jgi:hypothetical protein
VSFRGGARGGTALVLVEPKISVVRQWIKLVVVCQESIPLRVVVIGRSVEVVVRSVVVLWPRRNRTDFWKRRRAGVAKRGRSVGRIRVRPI